jgi:hypothetical protein
MNIILYFVHPVCLKNNSINFAAVFNSIAIARFKKIKAYSKRKPFRTEIIVGAGGGG